MAQEKFFTLVSQLGSYWTLYHFRSQTSIGTVPRIRIFNRDFCFDPESRLALTLDGFLSGIPLPL